MKKTDDLKKMLARDLFEIADFDYNTLLDKNNNSLFGGSVGLALFYYELYLYSSDEQYYNHSVTLFENAYNNLDLRNLNLSYGATGVMWLMNYFEKNGAIDMNLHEYCKTFDSMLLKNIHSYADNIDSMHGLLGIANYLLDRETETAKKALHLVVDMIEETKIFHPNGIAWEKVADLEDGQKTVHIIFGYAHGILSILYFISRIVSKGIQTEKGTKLLKEGFRFFLSFKDEKKRVFFPSRLIDNVPKETYRIAYCYGDLGIACGLTAIGKILRDQELLATGKSVANNIAKVALETIDSVEDIGLCHGASGNAYMFFKLYNTYGTDSLRKACIMQYEKLLTFKEESLGIAGYRSLDFDEGLQQFYRKADLGFISGTTGMGLAMLAFLKGSSENYWDRILFLT